MFLSYEHLFTNMYGYSPFLLVFGVLKLGFYNAARNFSDTHLKNKVLIIRYIVFLTL